MTNAKTFICLSKTFRCDPLYIFLVYVFKDFLPPSLGTSKFDREVSVPTLSVLNLHYSSLLRPLFACVDRNCMEMSMGQAVEAVEAVEAGKI